MLDRPSGAGEVAYGARRECCTRSTDRSARTPQRCKTFYEALTSVSGAGLWSSLLVYLSIHLSLLCRGAAGSTDPLAGNTSEPDLAIPLRLDVGRCRLVEDDGRGRDDLGGLKVGRPLTGASR